MSFRGILSGLVLAVSAWSGAAAAQVKVGYVDYQRALVEVEEARAAKSRLQGSLNSKQAELQKEQDALRKEKEILDKQAATMNDEARKAKQAELEGRFMALMQKFEKSKVDLAESERREIQPIINRMENVISLIAQREGLGLVLDKSAVIFSAPPTQDLTGEVVRLYNEQFKGKPSAKTAAPPKSDAPKK